MLWSVELSWPTLSLLLWAMRRDWVCGLFESFPTEGQRYVDFDVTQEILFTTDILSKLSGTGAFFFFALS